MVSKAVLFEANKAQNDGVFRAIAGIILVLLSIV